MIIKLNSDLSTIVKNFECIDRSYAKFLKREALADLNHNVSTTYVKVLDNAIAGYVTLTFNSYENKSVHRFPLKHLHIAKLATNSKHSGQGIGSALVYFSFQKALEIKEQVALYGVDLLVDREDEGFLSDKYYPKFGFFTLPTNPKHMFTSIETIESILK